MFQGLHIACTYTKCSGKLTFTHLASISCLTQRIWVIPLALRSSSWKYQSTKLIPKQINLKQHKSITTRQHEYIFQAVITRKQGCSSRGVLQVETLFEANLVGRCAWILCEVERCEKFAYNRSEYLTLDLVLCTGIWNCFNEYFHSNSNVPNSCTADIFFCRLQQRIGSWFLTHSLQWRHARAKMKHSL